MSTITTLAEGQINATDTLTVVLVRPKDMPPAVMIHWPDHPTVSPPLRFAEVAAAVCKIVARASTEMARTLGKQRRPR